MVLRILRCSRFSLVSGSQQIIEGVGSIAKNSGKIGREGECRKKVNALDGIIKDAIWRFEDSLESLLIQQIPSQFESIPKIVSIDLQSLQNDANSLIRSLKEMEEEYIYEVENMPQDQPISSIIGFHGTNSKMIGLSDLFQQLKTDLTIIHRHISPRTGSVYGLYGTAGIGKTKLAMQIYQDPQIQSMYECHSEHV